MIIADIRARRNLLRLIGRPHRRRRPIPRQRQPTAIRTAYYRALVDVLAQARARVERAIPIFRALLDRTARTDAAHTDAGEDDPNAILDALSDDFFREFTNERLARLSETYGRRTSDFQRQQIARQFKNALGIDIVQAEPWLEPKIRAFTADNVALIKSMPNRYFDDVEKTVVRAMRTGLRWEEIAKDIQGRFNVARNSARLIARDQVGKFMGEVNEARQEDLGIERFIWRTAKDNRVRDSHAELDGQVFRWDNPPIVDGEEATPGMPINCRCEAEPVLGPLLRAVGVK